MLSQAGVLLLVVFVTSQDSDTDAVDYLTQFGYIPKNVDGTRPFVDTSILNEAVKDFQNFAGLDPTGNLDSETKELMKTPRCGKEDRLANFVLQGSSWPKKSLTYRILSYPTANGISRRDVDLETRKAFNMWQDVSGLSFDETSSNSADIKISFSKGKHGDGNPFDGKGGVLAHAFFPRFGGDAHFDDDESWSVKPFVGNQILNTLTHEFGHSLGLSHSRVPGAIMAPFYKGWDPNLKLGDDDIKGIQKLYGRNNGSPGTPVTPRAPSPNPPYQPPNNPDRRPKFHDPDLCGSKLDAAVQTTDGVSYVFSGDSYWKLTKDSVADYGQKISSDWPGLPNNIDAAVTWQKNRVTYFFKGDQYWRFTGRSPSSGYPKDISAWGGIPANIDAAFAWGRNEDLYFFKGSQYWKYDTSSGTIPSDYPRSISIWNDVPQGIEAAFKWSNGKTYVFKCGEYWKLDGDTEAVDRSNPPYPRYAGKWWFGCPKKTPSFNIPLTDGCPKKTPSFNIPLTDGTEDYDFEQ